MTTKTTMTTKQATSTIRAATYGRVSTREQASNHSPEAQEKLTAQYVLSQGWEQVGAFHFDAVSGQDRHRPALGQIEALARRRAIDVVVVSKLDRMARRAGVLEDIERRLKPHGVRVVFTDQHFDDTAIGRCMKTVTGAFAGLEVDTITERMMTGRNEKAQKRRVNPNGKRVFGYRTITVAESQVFDEFRGRSGEYLINEREAGYVSEMFERTASGETLAVVARWLTSEGVLTSNGNHGWTAVSVRFIIQNPAYRGICYFGRRRCERGEEFDRDTGEFRKITIITPIPQVSWIPIDCPRIVSDALWTAANARLSENKSISRSNSEVPKHPLQGYVFCGHCVGEKGFHLRARGWQASPRNGRKRMYECQSRTREKLENCRTRVDAIPLEQAILKTLAELSEPGRLADMEREAVERKRAQARVARGQEKRLQREMDELDQQELALCKQWAAAGFSSHIVDKALSDIKARRETVQAQLRECITAGEKIPDAVTVTRVAEAEAARMREILDNPGDDTWKAIRDVLERVKGSVSIYNDRDAVVSLTVPLSQQGPNRC